jgi:CheY-like chemotaxis protein
MGSESKPQVLVVDDAKVVADTLAQILNLHGFQAVAAYSGEQALQLAGVQHFDHLVSDVVMDGMNGIEAAIAICGLLPQCTVLLMSGNNDTGQLLREAEGRQRNTSLQREVQEGRCDLQPGISPRPQGVSIFGHRMGVDRGSQTAGHS